MKKLIRKWLGIDYDPAVPTPPVEMRDVLHGAEMAMIAYRIDNGYLLRIGAGMISTTLIYCTNEKDMAEKLIAHRAKERVTGSSFVAKSAYQTNNLTNKY